MRGKLYEEESFAWGEERWEDNKMKDRKIERMEDRKEG